MQDILPDDAVHRVKEGVNDMAVLDRGMQAVKKDLGARISKRGGTWDEHLVSVVDAYNERPHEAVYGAPEDVEKGGVQEFMVLKDNAQKFMHNKKLTQRRLESVQEAEGFRAPVPTGGRSFNPQYSSNVHALRNITPGAQFVQDANRKDFLLKEVQPVPKDSGTPIGRLTDPQLGRRRRYQRQADIIKDFIADRGGVVNLLQLKNNLGAGLNMGLSTFLKLYGDVFIVQNGQVRLKHQNGRKERIARMMRTSLSILQDTRAAFGDRPV